MTGRRLRNLVLLALVAAAVAKIVAALRGGEAPQFSNHPSVNGGPAATPDLPLAAVPTPAEPEAPAETAAPAEAALTGGVDPVDGACPDGFPIKGKLKSGIYHQPGGLAYDRTRPDRCYATAVEAEADGLRPAKR